MAYYANLKPFKVANLLFLFLHFLIANNTSSKSGDVLSIRQFVFMNRFVSLNRWILSKDQRNVKNEDGQKCEENYYQESYFEQTLDHFGGNGVAKWRQKYQTNLQYYNVSSEWPVVFLVIGGEFRLDTKWICREGFPHMQMAKRHEAIVVQIEHRFFGDNNDVNGIGDLSLSNLQLLSSDQALADIAEFIAHFNAKHSLANARWICIGFSYAGTLAAWFKAKYPHLSVGAVAISAPIWPKVDFWEYEEFMANTIKLTSAECYEELRKAIRKVELNLQTENGRKELSILFGANPLLSADSLNLSNFLNTLLMAWQHTVQSPTATLLRKACNLMSNNSLSSQQKLFEVFRMVAFGDEGLYAQVDFSYNGTVSALAMTKPLDLEHAMMRAWVWMTCNEFGWFQTTDHENSLFGPSAVPLGYFYQFCSDIFGSKIGAKYIESRIEESRRKWGDGCTYNKAENVIFTNGLYDPWSALGIQHGFDCKFDDKNAQKNNGKIISVWTPKASHCAEFMPPSADEPPEFAITRQKVRDAVDKFLRNAKASIQNGANIRENKGILILSMLLFALFSSMS